MFNHLDPDQDLCSVSPSDSFKIFGLWVLGLAVSNNNESQLQTYESKTLFLMTSLQYYCIPGLPEIKTYAQKMQDAQVTKSLSPDLGANCCKMLSVLGRKKLKFL